MTKTSLSLSTTTQHPPKLPPQQTVILSTTPMTSNREPADLDVYHRQVYPYARNRAWPSYTVPMTATTTTHRSAITPPTTTQTHPTTPQPHPTTPSTKPATLPHQLTAVSSTTTMTPTPYCPAPMTTTQPTTQPHPTTQPYQTANLLTTPAPFQTPMPDPLIRAPIDLDAPHHPTTRHMQEFEQLFLSAPPTADHTATWTTVTTKQTTPTQSHPSDLTSLNHPTPTTHLTSTNLSLTERMLSNNPRATITLWTPDILLQRHTPTQTTTQLMLHSSLLHHVTGTFPTTLDHTAPITHSTPTNPTVPQSISLPSNFHWMATCLQRHPYPLHKSLTTTIKVLAHNRRPP